MDQATRDPGATGTEIGKSPARLMARRAVEGRGTFVDDLVLPRLADVAYVRSPYAHAEISGIDSTAAAAVPGVIAVVTGAEIAERMTPWLAVMENQPALKTIPQYALAVDRARWQGEPVCAVIAETRAIAEDAADLVAVDWRELPAVTRMETALDADTPVIHAEFGDNKMYERVVETGDADAGFAAAKHIVEQTYDFGRHTGVTLEPRAVISSYERSEKRLNVYYGGQAPHMIQTLYSKHLDIPERDIRVLTQECGGSYGIKSHLYGDEFATAVLSIMLDRPIRWRADRIESFVSDIHARHHRVKAKMGLDAEGRITAFEIDDLVGAGPFSAYPRTSIVEGNQVLNIAGGPYRVGGFRGKTTVVFQNMVPISQYRAVGHPMGIVACDSLLEKAAVAAGIDRVARIRSPAREPFKHVTTALNTRDRLLNRATRHKLHQCKVDQHDPQQSRYDQQQPSKNICAHDRRLPQCARSAQGVCFIGIVPPEIEIAQSVSRLRFGVVVLVIIGRPEAVVIPSRDHEKLIPQRPIQRHKAGVLFLFRVGRQRRGHSNVQRFDPVGHGHTKLDVRHCQYIGSHALTLTA